MQSNKIIGADNGKRRERDFYPTPPECTQALVNYLNLPHNTVIWECASGNGDMAKVFRDNGYKVIETDILYGQDFMTHSEKCDWIVTNPPFNQAEQFIKRAISFNVPFAFLLKSQYWHSRKRLDLFRENPPYAVLPLTWRPDFTGEGSSLMDMCWVVWKKNATLYIPLSKPSMGEK